MNSFLKTVIGGALGLAALYLVAKVSFAAGKEVANVERDYEEIKKSEDVESNVDVEETCEITESEESEIVTIEKPEKTKKTSKLGMIFGLGKLMRNKNSVIGRLVRNPEKHKIEAFISGNGIRINVKPRTA